MAAARRIDPPGAVASKWFVTAVGTSVAVVAAQLLVVRLLDAGWLYPTYRFYLAVVAVPILVGTLLSKRWAALLGSAALSNDRDLRLLQVRGADEPLDGAWK